jgi:hypothetical protein
MDERRHTAAFKLRVSPAMNPTRPPAVFFFHPDGEKRPSRAPNYSFSPGFGPSSIRRVQAIPAPLACARGLRTREKRGRARSVGERTREPHYLVANPSLPPLVALSPPAPPFANSPAGCLHSAVSLLPPAYIQLSGVSSAYISPSSNSSRRASSTRPAGVRPFA